MGVAIFRREFEVDPSARGHHVVYRLNESNRCPGCGRAHWYVGRVTAECGFCGTAVALAESKWSGAFTEAPAKAGDERRRHERIDARGRNLQLLIDGSPQSFALENISAGGVQGECAAGLEPSSTVYVRFEGGILVPAMVKWTDGALVGLAFTDPVILDTSRG
jgi:PilZ domain